MISKQVFGTFLLYKYIIEKGKYAINLYSSETGKENGGETEGRMYGRGTDGCTASFL